MLKGDKMGRELARTVVITGAASGLGRAMAVAWGSRGWKVGVADIDAADAEETVELVKQAGGGAEFWRCDVRDPVEVQAMADHFFDAWGEVGVLANNAGVSVVGLVGDILLENWKRIMETSLWGVIYGCHAFIPGMKQQGAGHIVNTASVAGLINLPEMGPYNLVKAGVISLSETLKVELAPHGVGVTVVCPSFFKTNLEKSGTCTDVWESEFIRTATANAKMSADSVASRVLAAVDGNKLYEIPQRDVKRVWRIKRSAPALWCSGMARFYGSKWGRPALLWLARKGMC